MTIKCCEFEGVALPSLAEFVNLTELTLTECKVLTVALTAILIASRLLHSGATNRAVLASAPALH